MQDFNNFINVSLRSIPPIPINLKIILVSRKYFFPLKISLDKFFTPFPEVTIANSVAFKKML